MAPARQRQLKWRRGAVPATGLNGAAIRQGHGLAALLHLSVKSRAQSTPPASPAEGDRYIVGPSPADAWAGRAEQIAVRIEGAWEFHVPQVGWLAFIEDEAVLSAYKTTGWSPGLAL